MRLGLLVLVGCAARAPESLGNAGAVRAKPPEPLTRILVKRPGIDILQYLPDPTEEARWPLPASQHPAFEPHYDIAGALAQRGIGWLELCRMGAQHRYLSGDRDLGNYLRAWRFAADGHIPEAVAALGAMGTPTISGMPAAIRSDIADLLVENGDADHAAHVLDANQLDRLEELDLLAASYFDTSHDADAFAINERALGASQQTTPGDRCHRLARKIVLAHESTRPMWLLDLDQAAAGQGDTECARLDAELRCAIRLECGRFLIGDPDIARKLALIRAYRTWPALPATQIEWQELAGLARRAEPLEGSDVLASAAAHAAGLLIAK